jgi:hypothetical protein
MGRESNAKSFLAFLPIIITIIITIITKERF